MCVQLSWRRKVVSRRSPLVGPPTPSLGRIDRKEVMVPLDDTIPPIDVQVRGAERGGVAGLIVGCGALAGAARRRRRRLVVTP